jgi:tetratricopeptide (TPR) repeat protein
MRTWHAGVALGILALALVIPGADAHADEPWEAEVRAAEEEENRLLEDAKRSGNLAQLEARYASRLGRHPTALNHYLYARVLYHAGKAAEADRQLRRVLQLEPRFWFANLRLAMLEIERGNLEEAERHLKAVLSRRPREPDALQLLALLRTEAKDWNRALRVLEDLLSLDPENLQIRMQIALVLMEKKDWGRAVKELRILRGRRPRDPLVRRYYATALFQAGSLKDAARELEGYLRLQPDDLGALDMLQIIYARLEDRKGFEATLERMLPLAPNDEARDKIQEMLDRLRAPPGPAEAMPQATWEDMVERCTDEKDVEKRRAALQAYYASNFPRVPDSIVKRAHYTHEPDPICRRWVLRIIGQMTNPLLAQVAAYALRDPDMQVQAGAAEALGEIGTASGVIYLLPTLLGSKLDAPPTPDQVAVLNAARWAMIFLTDRADAFGSKDVAVPAESLKEMRDDWMVWFASEDGVHARLAGIKDLEAQKDLRPELFLLEDVSDPSLEIAKAAYGVLLRRSKKPSHDAVAAAMWPLFPKFEESDLTEEGMGKVRGAVVAWWKDWVAMRQKGSGSSGD